MKNLRRSILPHNSKAVIFAILGILSMAAVACSTAPAPTPIPTAAPAPAPAPTATTPPAPQAPAPAAPAQSGSAVVVEISEGTVARYSVTEQLARNDLPNDAVGETSNVSGSIVIGSDGTVDSSRSKITVNVQSLVSDEDRRDNFIKENSLESNTFPTAEIAVNQINGLSLPLPQNGEASFQMSGDVTIHGVTRPMTWDVKAQFSSGSVTGQAKAMTTFDEFNINKPSLFFILSLDDEIRLELDFNATVGS